MLHCWLLLVLGTCPKEDAFCSKVVWARTIWHCLLETNSLVVNQKNTCTRFSVGKESCSLSEPAGAAKWPGCFPVLIIVRGNPGAWVVLDVCLLAVCYFTGGSMFSSVKGFEGQQYSALKSQCQQSGGLFEDPLFPPTDASLFYQGNRIGRVHWKRPKVSEDAVSAPFPCWANEKLPIGPEVMNTQRKYKLQGL